MGNVCKGCGLENFIPRKYRPDFGFCARPSCQIKQTEWSKRNWDQIPSGHRIRNKAEDEFWEVTDAQKERYSNFYSLVRPKRTVKKRNCLRCQKEIVNKFSTLVDYRLCSRCQEANARTGVHAY